MIKTIFGRLLRGGSPAADDRQVIATTTAGSRRSRRERCIGSVVTVILPGAGRQAAATARFGAAQSGRFAYECQYSPAVWRCNRRSMPLWRCISGCVPPCRTPVVGVASDGVRQSLVGRSRLTENDAPQENLTRRKTLTNMDPSPLLGYTLVNLHREFMKDSLFLY